MPSPPPRRPVEPSDLLPAPIPEPTPERAPRAKRAAKEPKPITEAPTRFSDSVARVSFADTQYITRVFFGDGNVLDVEHIGKTWSTDATAFARAMAEEVWGHDAERRVLDFITRRAES